MKRVCCYCGKVYGNALKPPPGLPPNSVSHGICPDCVPRANAELDALIAKSKAKRDPCADCCREGAACQDCPDYD